MAEAAPPPATDEDRQAALPHGVTITYRDSGGAPDAPVALLIMGLGMQLTSWPEPFVQHLRAAGFRVVRFDNRDAGLSTQFDHLGTPNVAWETVKKLMGFTPRAPYALAALAADTLALMDALQLGNVHLVGVSMGGMIAQHVAAKAPARVKSLTSIMSSSGKRGLPGPTPAARRALMSRPAEPGMDGLLKHYVKVWHTIGSPAYPVPDEQLVPRLRAGIERAFRPQGTLRQLLAISADNERPGLLSKISAPTLVIHGEADPLVPIACGRDTAAAIPGARFEAIAGMGHDLPPQLHERLAGLITAHARSA
jgi:pimeloyl-ACP methyl ester carboxylesterase